MLLCPLFLDDIAQFAHRTFCVAAGGYRPKTPLCDAVLLPSYATPTLHILGRTDVIIHEERSKELLDVCANKRVEWHDGGARACT